VLVVDIYKQISACGFSYLHYCTYYFQGLITGIAAINLLEFCY